MNSSEVYIEGDSFDVTIIDKSKRAYDISLDSTKACALALQKSRIGCKYSFIRFRAMWYSLWLLMLKHHGRPPGRGGLNCLFFAFASFVSIDILLTVIIYVHVLTPFENIFTFGFPWLFILPLVTMLGPIFGFVGAMTGSPEMLKAYSSYNATAFLVNIPLTLLFAVYYGTQGFYLVVLLSMMITKVFLSFFGGKVR